MTLLDPPAFVWCIAGPHIGESLDAIVVRKRRDIDRFGWCLWAYGGSGDTHPEMEVRRLASEYTSHDPLLLLMPATGKQYPDVGMPFDGFADDRDGPSVDLPDSMSPVTGGRASWAFWLTDLRLESNTHVDVARHVAPFTRKGAQPLADYLKGSHGRACAARTGVSTEPLGRQVHVVAELSKPYAVFLRRSVGTVD